MKNEANRLYVKEADDRDIAKAQMNMLRKSSLLHLYKICTIVSIHTVSVLYVLQCTQLQCKKKEMGVFGLMESLGEMGA